VPHGTIPDTVVADHLKAWPSQKKMGPWGIWKYHTQWIGLRENLQENSIFDGKIHGFRLSFPNKTNPLTYMSIDIP